MMKFYDIEKEIFELKDQVSIIDQELSPFKEILSRNKMSSFSFSLDDNGEKINLGKSFYLRVAIKGSSSITFFLDEKGINKEALINSISSLCSLDGDYKEKTEKLFSVFKSYNPYFAIYQSKSESALDVNSLREINKNIPILYLEYKKEKVELSPEEKEKQEEIDFNNRKDRKLGETLLFDLKNIKKNKYHFLFLTVSSFLFGFAASIGYCNALLGKLICILFFVCAAVGVFLNTYVYHDYFLTRKIKDRLFIWSIIFDVIGLGLALGATLLFHHFDKGGIYEAASAGKVALITIIMQLVMFIFSISIGYLIVNMKKSKKEEK